VSCILANYALLQQQWSDVASLAALNWDSNVQLLLLSCHTAVSDTAGWLYVGTLPSPLATSISANYLDVSDNQLTALPAEWTNGFTNATQSSFVNIFLEQNQIQVCFLLSTLSMNIWLRLQVN